jgi:hypothetical protein
VTIFLSNDAARLSVGSQQRELALGLLDKKVNQVTFGVGHGLVKNSRIARFFGPISIRVLPRDPGHLPALHCECDRED